MEKYLSKHPVYLRRSSKLNKHQPGEEERRPNSAKHRGEFRRLDAKTFTSGEFESDSDDGDSSCVVGGVPQEFHSYSRNNSPPYVQ